MTMEQIADWLKKRGMSEYVQRFIQNSVLPDLTDQDLERLGVLLGDRRKMLRWIGELKGAEKVVPAESRRAVRPCLSIAREQKAKSWELRSAMSMARLWRDQGKRRQHAHELLATVYGWFSEGFDTLDLKQARTLLKDLA